MKRIMMIMALVMMASTAWAQVSLDVVWTDLQFRGTFNSAESVAFNRNRVIAGELFADASGSQVSVRGYNANTGDLRWEDTIPNAFQVLVDAAGTDAFAAVNTMVRSYNQRTGDIQWSTSLPFEIAMEAFGVRGNRVLLVGYGAPNPAFRINGFVFVLDRTTGNLLWTAQLEPIPQPIGDPNGSNNIFWDFDRSGTDVIVVGQRQTPAHPGLMSTMIVRDYRVSDGQVKWEVIEPNRTPTHTQLANGLVYVSGDSFIAAYALANGASVWQAAGGASAFTASGTGIFLTDSSPAPMLVRRHPFTGALVWQSPIPSEVNRQLAIRGLGIVHGYIVLVGWTVVPPIISGNEQLLVFVYDEHGNLLLEDKQDQAVRAEFRDKAIQGNRIVGVGRLSGPLGGAFVRMYQLLTGIQP